MEMDGSGKAVIIIVGAGVLHNRWNTGRQRRGKVWSSVGVMGVQVFRFGDAIIGSADVAELGWRHSSRGFLQKFGWIQRAYVAVHVTHGTLGAKFQQRSSVVREASGRVTVWHRGWEEIFRRVEERWKWEVTEIGGLDPWAYSARVGSMNSREQEHEAR